jgi:hypothetical protein
LLKDYVNIRLQAVSVVNIEEGIEKSEELQDNLWQLAISVAKKEPQSYTVGLFIESLNQVIDLHSKRVNIGLRIRIPFIIWSVLYFVTILSVGCLGYQAGLTQTRYTGITLLLVLIFSIVLLLIADLDRPQEGYIKISQQPLVDLMDKFGKAKE